MVDRLEKKMNWTGIPAEPGPDVLPVKIGVVITGQHRHSVVRASSEERTEGVENGGVRGVDGVEFGNRLLLRKAKWHFVFGSGFEFGTGPWFGLHEIEEITVQYEFDGGVSVGKHVEKRLEVPL